MPEVLANSRITSEKELFFINQTKIIGAQSIEINNELSVNQLKYLGFSNRSVPYLPQSEQIAQLNVNALLVNQDYFLEYVTGSNLFNAYILREQNNITNNYSLLSGYATNFSCSYSVGEPPQINFQAIITNNAGRIVTGQFNSPQVSDLTVIRTGNYNRHTLVPDGGSITLTLDDNFNTNRIISYNLDVSVNKVPIYNIGSRNPKRIQTSSPANVLLDITFEVGDYTYYNLRTFPQTPRRRNLTLTVKSQDLNNTLATYFFSGLELTNENRSTNVNGNETIQQIFQGAINI